MNRRYLLFFAIAFLLSSCSSSLITTSWKDKDVTPQPYKKVLVLGLIGDPDRSLREKMEQHFVGDLQDLGYSAFSAMQVYGPKAFENVKESEAIQQLRDKGFDAIITIVLLNKSRERYYTYGKMIYSPYAIYQEKFWGYYSTMYDRVYSAGYYAEETKYFWESNFYDVASLAPRYSVQSQSFEPGSARTLGHEYGLMIVQDMVKQKVLQKQTPGVLKPF